MTTKKAKTEKKLAKIKVGSAEYWKDLYMKEVDLSMGRCLDYFDMKEKAAAEAYKDGFVQGILTTVFWGFCALLVILAVCAII